MLLKATNLKGFHLGALDGEIGHVKDFYFDDTNWHIRYLIADTGRWLPHRKVLIAPNALGTIHLKERVIDVHLTRDQVENSPSIDLDKPVSRQMEEDYLRYFGWPFYWSDPLMWGMPVMANVPPSEGIEYKEGDPHLRSISELMGYEMQARDGDLGRVEDFLVDDEDWSIHELIVDAHKWHPGKRVLISPLFIKNVNWAESRVNLRLEREALESELQEYHPADEGDGMQAGKVIQEYAAGHRFPLP